MLIGVKNESPTLLFFLNGPAIKVGKRLNDMKPTFEGKTKTSQHDLIWFAVPWGETYDFGDTPTPSSLEDSFGVDGVLKYCRKQNLAWMKRPSIIMFTDIWHEVQFIPPRRIQVPLKRFRIFLHLPIECKLACWS